jgi:hypothetical protein
MAIVLEANYAKKLGLPNFSSHQYCVTIRTELTDLSQVAEESARLYRVLQDAVDHEIKAVGFMPDASTYGMHPSTQAPTNGANGHRQDDNGHLRPNGTNRNSERWNCTDGQRGFILRILNENQLDKAAVEALARELFSAGVKDLDKLQASQLIEELLDQAGRKTNGRRPHWQGRQPVRA